MVAAAYPDTRAAVFEQFRRRLFGIAYRMIGTTADAEDIVQEAYLRWHQADTEEIRSAEAWLVSVVTRLSIDKLRKASGFARKVPLTCLVAAMPPDVRRGYASPFNSKLRMGLRPRFGLGPNIYGPKAEPGA